MAPKTSCKEKGKANARAKMPTLVINRRLSLDPDRIKGFISEHICGPIWIYKVCGVKNLRAWDLFYDIIFLDPVMTRHFSLVLATVPDRHYGSGSGSKPNLCQIGVPGRQ